MNRLINCAKIHFKILLFISYYFLRAYNCEQQLEPNTKTYFVTRETNFLRAGILLSCYR